MVGADLENQSSKAMNRGLGYHFYARLSMSSSPHSEYRCGEALRSSRLSWKEFAGLGGDRLANRQSEGSVTEVRRRERLLPIGAAAQYLEVSRAAVERLVYRGELAIVKVAIHALRRRGSRRLHRNQPVPESQADSLKGVTLRDLIERKRDGS